MERPRRGGAGDAVGTRDGTARAHADYVPKSGTLAFRPGETRKWVHVRILPDDHDDDGETVKLRIFEAQGAAIRDLWLVSGQTPPPGTRRGPQGRTPR